MEIHDITPNHTESSLRIHLGQALSRKDTMNVAVQKAVELGATSITPLICDFTDAKIDANFLSKRQQQWQKVVVGASEQSGRAILADLTPTQPLAAWLTQVQQTSLTSANTTLNLYLDVTNGNYLRILGQEHALVNQVNIAVGPEGGFSESEVTLLQDQGFTAINLGPRILRFETAAMAAIAICQSIWGDA